MKLNNKTIIITGASDGIGKQIALSLASEETKLVLIGRDVNKLKAVQQEVLTTGAKKAEIYSCDISDNNAIKSTAKQIEKNFKHIDVLINNAGIFQKIVPLEEIDSSTIQDIIQINLVGLINMTQAILPMLKKQDEAALINISSKAGVVAQKNINVYNASKFGVTGFTESLRIDLKESNVRVAGVYQAGINTSMFSSAGENFSTEHFSEPDDLANIVKFMLMQPAKIWLHEVRVEF